VVGPGSLVVVSVGSGVVPVGFVSPGRPPPSRQWTPAARGTGRGGL